MTDEQRGQIIAMRENGIGYKKIGQMLGISENTVKSFCQRRKISSVEIKPDERHTCRNCNKPVKQIPGRKKKKFCSDKCRMEWWNSHLNQVKRKANYDFICPYCKKPFTVYGNANRKYCSHACYMADRFGGRA